MRIERRALLSTVWMTSVVLLLAPLWYTFMAIQRAPLDYEQLDELDRNINDLISIRVPIHLDDKSGNLKDISSASQMIMERRLDAQNVKGWKPDLYASPEEAVITVQLSETDSTSYHLSSSGKLLEISYDQDLLVQGRLPEVVADLLLREVFNKELEFFAHGDSALSEVVARYASEYHLTFSLMVENGQHHSWDIDSALYRLDPLRGFLSQCSVNTTADSQVQYYARLNSEPTHQDNNEWTLNEHQLTTFVNFAEWSLVSSQHSPTLHFVLYIPSSEHSPLLVQGSDTNSFMVAQWGGVVIANGPLLGKTHISANDLEPVLEVFANQLMSLLGAPSEPKSPHLRVSSLSRITAARAVKASAAALGSLRRLALRMPEIAIPKRVARRSKAALKAVESSLQSLKRGSVCAAVSTASVAFDAAEKAFFDHQMVAQMFFPDEHKMAVYLPLLGPLGFVLFSGWNRMRKRTHLDPQIETEILETFREAQQMKKDLSNVID